MTDSLLPRDPKATARLAGLSYLIIIICGIFAQIAVRGALIDGSDAAATAANIRENPTLLGIGVLADFIVYFLDLVLAVAFYRLFAKVNQSLALFAAWLRIAMTALLMVNLINFAAPLFLLGDSRLAGQIAPEQAEILSLLFLQLHSAGFVLGLMMFGVYGLMLGSLIIRSSFMPALIGALVIVSGASYFAMGVINFVLPEYRPMMDLLLISAALPEFVFTAWLLLVGLNRIKWEALADRA